MLQLHHSSFEAHLLNINKMYFAVVLVCALAAVAHSYPAGNPQCETDFPIHGVKPQTSPSPYVAIVEKPNLKSGETTKVTLQGKNGEKFKGFVLIAKSAGKQLGTLAATDDGTKIVDCGSGANAATMSDPSDKEKVVVQWKAPADLKGTVNFHFMIVKSFAEIWISQKSEDVTVS